MLEPKLRERLSKSLAYILRHDIGVRRSDNGFVSEKEVLERLRRRFPWVTSDHLIEIVNLDKKGRYERKEGFIRAKYGHSVPVRINLPEAEVDVLYHGTASEMLEKIMKEGLKPMRRLMVHLSRTPAEALKVAKRHSKNPVVLKIDVKKAKELGVKILKASEEVYLAKEIPPTCIISKCLNNS
ncbi:MAG: RNA 2'-phosphotransferase [Candidatus Hadarchaeales archaeon]